MLLFSWKNWASSKLQPCGTHKEYCQSTKALICLEKNVGKCMKFGCISEYFHSIVTCNKLMSNNKACIGWKLYNFGRNNKNLSLKLAQLAYLNTVQLGCKTYGLSQHSSQRNIYSESDVSSKKNFSFNIDYRVWYYILIYWDKFFK